MLHKNVIQSLIALLFSLSLQAQQSLTGRMGATIVQPAQTISAAAFNFGQVLPTSGHISIAPDGTMTVDGKTTAQTAGTNRAASLVIKGSPRTSISFCLPTQVELRGPAGAKLVASGFKSDFTSGTTNSTGERQIGMGTTLTLSSNSQRGSYIGHMDVLVAYN